MLKPHVCDRARVGMGCTISIEKSKRQNGGRFKFRCICFHFAAIRRKKTAKVFTISTALKGASLLYTCIFFNKETISATIVNFLVEFTRSQRNMKTWVFIALVVVVGFSGGRFPDEKAFCLSSKTLEKNVCRGRMTGLSTEMTRVAEVDRGNFVMKRASDRKCLNLARAQWFDRCEAKA